LKTVLGIIASPRRMGNCETIVKAVCRGIGQEHRLNLLRLTDFDIKPCRACYMCLFEDRRCPIEDDLEQILDAIADADAVILACPAYFLAPHSGLKRFVDRGLSFYRRADRLWEKPALGIGVAGIKHMEGHTLLGIENFLKVMLADVKAVEMFYGALPGEILLDKDNIQKARGLGRSLFKPAPGPAQPSCSLCGGTTFRFLGRDKVRCMLCSNTGKIDFSGGRVVFKMEKSPHVLFLSRQEALDHKKWLIGMKQDFALKKKDLVRAAAQYRRDGTWITPAKKDKP